MEGSKQGPFLFVSPSGQKNKYTVNYCKDYCDQQFNDCTGFIKTSSQCKFMSNVSRCTGYGSGSLNYYVRNYTKYVTNAPTILATASPTSPTTWISHRSAHGLSYALLWAVYFGMVGQENMHGR